MAVIDLQPTTKKMFQTPVRNNYFFGKLLDVYHFQLETDYFNNKRSLLNRLVSGYGVVCGLDVQPGPDGQHIVVSPGFAIDKWGREILVPEKTAPIPIPDRLLPRPKNGQGDEDCDPVVRVLLCYHECESDPMPVLAGDCGTVEECAPGTIRERYRIVIKEGAAPPIRLNCRIPDLFYGGKLDYEALVKHVSEGCSPPPADPCIPLANIRLSRRGPGHCCEPERIDIAVRPVVYTNDLIVEIILSLLAEQQDDHRHAK